MGVKIKLFNRDGSFYREVEIPNFYIRPDAIVADNAVFITKAPESQRKDLEYTMIEFFFVETSDA